MLTLKDQVYHLLRQYPFARENDFFLQWMWLIQYGGLHNLPNLREGIFKGLGSGIMDSISRVRRKIQEHKQLMPVDPKVYRKRQEQAEFMRQIMPRLDDYGNQK